MMALSWSVARVCSSRASLPRTTKANAAGGGPSSASASAISRTRIASDTVVMMRVTLSTRAPLSSSALTNTGSLARLSRSSSGDRASWISPSKRADGVALRVEDFRAGENPQRGAALVGHDQVLHVALLHDARGFKQQGAILDADQRGAHDGGDGLGGGLPRRQHPVAQILVGHNADRLPGGRLDQDGAGLGPGHGGGGLVDRRVQVAGGQRQRRGLDGPRGQRQHALQIGHQAGEGFLGLLAGRDVLDGENLPGLVPDRHRGGSQQHVRSLALLVDDPGAPFRSPAPAGRRWGPTR